MLEIDALVIGGGIQGLVALRELTRAGYACALVTNSDLGTKFRGPRPLLPAACVQADQEKRQAERSLADEAGQKDVPNEVGGELWSQEDQEAVGEVTRSPGATQVGPAIPFRPNVASRFQVFHSDLQALIAKLAADGLQLAIAP